MEEKTVYERGWSDRFVGLKDLVCGRVYFTGENKVLMYLGVAKSGKHLFYQFASAVMSTRVECRTPDGEAPSYRDQYTIITFANYDAQVTGIRLIMELSMKSRADRACVIGVKKNPGVIGEFPCCHYEDKYLAWYKESFSNDQMAPIIIEAGMKTDYVQVKDLVPGHLYYTGAGSAYCFLGRSSEGYFVWHPVGWGRELRTHIDDAEYLCSCVEVTKNNKRCKPLRLLLRDEDAYLRSPDTLELAENDTKVDAQILDQGLIEQAARRSMGGY